MNVRNSETLKLRNSQLTKFLDSEIMKFWNSEILESWNYEIVKFWNWKIMKFRNSEFIKLWNFEILKLWNYSITGTQNFWSFEPSLYLLSYLIILDWIYLYFEFINDTNNFGWIYMTRLETEPSQARYITRKYPFWFSFSFWR